MTTTAGLGSLPASWRSKRAKWVLLRQSRPAEAGDGIVTAFRDGQVTLRSNRRTSGFTEADLEIGYQGIRKGDLVVHSMDAFAGAIGVSDSDGKASPVVHAYRPIGDFEARFGAFVLQAMASSGYVTTLAKGIRERSTSFDPQTFADLEMPCPPVDEQRRIVDFLDAELARLGQLAQLRQKQVEIVAVHDAAEVYETIRGASLERSAQDSGFAWLGKVAAGFRIAAVSHEFEVALGKMLNPARTQGDHLRCYLRNTNVQWDHIDTSDLLLMDFPPAERHRYEVRAGDLLVCEGGEPGRAAIWNGSVSEVYYQKALHRVRPRGTSSVRWLYYCLRAATYMNVFAVQGNTTTIAHLTGEQLKAQRFPFPDRPTQDKLVAMLDDRSRDRLSLRTTVDRQLALLAERRQALIAAAVTGQIDVTTARGVTV